jgi:hypothetical protein
MSKLWRVTLRVRSYDAIGIYEPRYFEVRADTEILAYEEAIKAAHAIRLDVGHEPRSAEQIDDGRP